MWKIPRQTKFSKWKTTSITALRFLTLRKPRLFLPMFEGKVVGCLLLLQFLDMYDSLREASFICKWGRRLPSRIWQWMLIRMSEKIRSGQCEKERELSRKWDRRKLLDLMFVDPYIILQFLRWKTQQDATVLSKFYYSLFYMKLNMFRATHRPSSGA